MSWIYFMFKLSIIDLLCSLSYVSRGWFRSIDLWVMGPACFRCATLLHAYVTLSQLLVTSAVSIRPLWHRQTWFWLISHYNLSGLLFSGRRFEPFCEVKPGIIAESVCSCVMVSIRLNRRWFQSIDLWVTGPAHVCCPTLLHIILTSWFQNCWPRGCSRWCSVLVNMWSDFFLVSCSAGCSPEAQLHISETTTSRLNCDFEPF